MIAAERDLLISYMREFQGLDLSVFDEAFLDRTVESRMAALHISSVSAYISQLPGPPPEIPRLLSALQVGESEFFRDSLGFGLLEQYLLPFLFHRKGDAPVRIWSAGCAAGQEPYSLAILCHELASARFPGARYQILATDSAADSLKAAAIGVFPPWTLLNVRRRHLDAHFLAQADGYALADSLRSQVEFHASNLLDPPPAPSPYFDLILCANVLAYYTRAAQSRILDHLRLRLHPEGFLMLGEAERNAVPSGGVFERLSLPGVVFRAP
jgi:two-component system CheB/CheR fusion protein